MELATDCSVPSALKNIFCLGVAQGMKKSTQTTSCTMFSVTRNDALQSKPAKYAQLCLTPDDNMYYIRAMPDKDFKISRHKEHPRGNIDCTRELGASARKILPLSRKAKCSSEDRNIKKRTFSGLQSRTTELVASPSVKGSLTFSKCKLFVVI